MHVSIGEAGVMLGVSVSTLRRWERLGKLMPSFRTTGNHRRYCIAHLRKKLGTIKESVRKKAVAYARVSSHDQKEDLTRQVERLNSYCMRNQQINSYEIISDLGSGLNYKKRGLKRLLKMILTGKVSRIVLTHKDRLLRFGSELIFTLCSFFDISVILIDEEEAKSDEEILTRDVLEIITVFSARLYGKRAHKKSPESVTNARA